MKTNDYKPSPMVHLYAKDDELHTGVDSKGTIRVRHGATSEANFEIAKEKQEHIDTLESQLTKLEGISCKENKEEIRELKQEIRHLKREVRQDLREGRYHENLFEHSDRKEYEANLSEDWLYNLTSKK